MNKNKYNGLDIFVIAEILEEIEKEVESIGHEHVHLTDSPLGEKVFQLEGKISCILQFIDSMKSASACAPNFCRNMFCDQTEPDDYSWIESQIPGRVAELIDTFVREWTFIYSNLKREHKDLLLFLEDEIKCSEEFEKKYIHFTGDDYVYVGPGMNRDNGLKKVK